MLYFKGKFENNLAKVESYFPGIENDKILGQLSAPAPTRLLISLKKEHGGCRNVWHFADQNPADFDLIKAYPWQSVRIVRAAKAYFYDSPQTEHHRKAYLVKSDGVGVRSQKNGWLEGDYTSNEKPVSGWMKESDFFSQVTRGLSERAVSPGTSDRTRSVRASYGVASLHELARTASAQLASVKSEDIGTTSVGRLHSHSRILLRTPGISCHRNGSREARASHRGRTGGCNDNKSLLRRNFRRSPWSSQALATPKRQPRAFQQRLLDACYPP
jgi:hypothetical protein